MLAVLSVFEFLHGAVSAALLVMLGCSFSAALLGMLGQLVLLCFVY